MDVPAIRKSALMSFRYNTIRPNSAISKGRSTCTGATICVGAPSWRCRRHRVRRWDRSWCRRSRSSTCRRRPLGNRTCTTVAMAAAVACIHSCTGRATSTRTRACRRCATQSLRSSSHVIRVLATVRNAVLKPCSRARMLRIYNDPRLLSARALSTHPDGSLDSRLATRALP